MAFHVGQKVVCVDNSPNRHWGLTPLDLNSTYTVLRVVFEEGDPVPGLFLHEAQAKAPMGFCSTRFRPAVERKTDISIFTEMLKPKERVICGND